MASDIQVNRPTPTEPGDEIDIYDINSDLGITIQTLEEGRNVLVTRTYGDGLVLLKELHNYLGSKMPNTSFQEQREYRSAFHTISNRVLVEITDHKLTVKKSPAIGWLEKLYPEFDHFFLTLPQVQGLNSAWQWYTNGISTPVLRNKIHPYYGIYFPTRFEHLSVFDNWLKRYGGPKKSAIDVGIGSGILSLQMVQHGFQKVFGTDTNPNAIIGLKEFMGTTKLSRKIELDFGHLFGCWKKPTELIVFNPPWLPESHDLDKIDEAIYYNDKLFPEFFAEAEQKLLPEGKLLVIFSNLAQVTNLTQEHPIEQELENGGRFKLEKCFKKTVKAASDKTKRDQNWRATEVVELWVLVKK